jgi:hypothetical protein
MPVESAKLKMCRRGNASPSANSLTKEGRTPLFPGFFIEANNYSLGHAKLNKPSDGSDIFSVSAPQLSLLQKLSK